MMLVANAFFASIDTTVKWMIGLGVPALQMAFLRYAGHFVVNVAEISIRGVGALSLPRQYLGLTILRGCILVIATVLNFVALQYLSLTVISAIVFSAPIIICFLSGPLLGERVGPWRWLAIFIGFIGVLIVINPLGETFHWAVILSLLNALCLALYSLMTRQLAGKVSAAAMQFSTAAIGTAVLAPFVVWGWQAPSSGWMMVFWFGVGLFGWAGHELLTRAHAYAPASLLMPFSYSFLIYMTIYSVVLFADPPTQNTLFGVGVIVAAGLLIWWRETRKSRPSGEGEA